jgi:hypothetical protein
VYTGFRLETYGNETTRKTHELGWREVAGTCECSYVLSDAIKCKEFFD